MRDRYSYVTAWPELVKHFATQMTPLTMGEGMKLTLTKYHAYRITSPRRHDPNDLSITIKCIPD